MFGAKGDDAQVIASLVSNIPIALVWVLVFAILHYFFASLFYINTERGRAPAKTSGTWGWICEIVVGMDDDEYMKHAGLDALTFVEFIRLCARVLGVMLVWACVVNMTFYVLSANHSLDPKTNTSGSAIDPEVLNSFLARSSLANVRPIGVGDPYEWDQALAFAMSLLGMWVVSFYTYWQLKRTWRRVIKWAQRAMAVAGDPSSHAILVRSVDPREKMRSPEELCVTPLDRRGGRRLIAGRLLGDDGWMDEMNAR